MIIFCQVYSLFHSIYRIAGNFRGVLIFVIFVTILRVTKFSTHEIFHPRIFSRLLRIGLRKSRNLKPRKLILKTRDSFSRKFAPPKITRYTVYTFKINIYLSFLMIHNIVVTNKRTLASVIDCACERILQRQGKETNLRTHFSIFIEKRLLRWDLNPRFQGSRSAN